VLQVRGPRRGRGVVPRAKATPVHGSIARDGYAVARAVVDATIVAAALDHLAGLPGDGALRTAPLAKDLFFASVVRLPGLVALACDALGVGNVVAFGATYVVKPPHVGLPARWHQDGHPWEARGILRAVTVGIALDATTDENGCLRVIPGSHVLAAQPLLAVESPANVFSAEIDPALVDESLAVSVPLGLGDCSIHLPSLIHGSGPNVSDGPRRTLVLRYRAR
jgi:ectoine hydroxylase-related dioxygenase (phytanoyl-CoA dioxygenase family)